MRRESIGRLLLGLGTGTLFGFLLQKGRAAKHQVIEDQLRLRNWDVVKIMSTAGTVGAAGTHALVRAGRVELSVKPLRAGGVVTGGVLFGAGMALLGYCPGTSIAAVGEGRRDALAGVLGMFLGAMAYVRLLPRMKPFLERGDVGTRTLPQLTGTSPWLWVAGSSAAVGASAALARRRSGSELRGDS